MLNWNNIAANSDLMHMSSHRNDFVWDGSGCSAICIYHAVTQPHTATMNYAMLSNSWQTTMGFVWRMCIRWAVDRAHQILPEHRILVRLSTSFLWTTTAWTKRIPSGICVASVAFSWYLRCSMIKAHAMNTGIEMGQLHSQGRLPTWKRFTLLYTSKQAA